MAKTEGPPSPTLICAIAVLLHLSLSLLSEYYRIFAGMYPAVLVSRVLGLGHPRGDVVPGAVSSAITLTPIVLLLEGLVVAAIGAYYWKRDETK